MRCFSLNSGSSRKALSSRSLPSLREKYGRFSRSSAFELLSGSGSQKFGYEKPASRSTASPITSASAALTATSPAFLIQFEFVLIVLFQRGVLRFLAQEAVAHRERLDLGAHEAAERVL